MAVPLVAMANAEGGYVVVGIHDGAVDGVAVPHLNTLRQAAQDFTSPVVRCTATELSTSDGRIVLMLRVDPGECVHESTKGDVYLRVGDESRKLGYDLLADYNPKGAVSKEYGAYDEQAGCSKRALFVVDADGVISWSYLSPMAINPGVNGVLDALEALKNKNA